MIHSCRIIQTLLILLLWIAIGADCGRADFPFPPIPITPPRIEQLDGWNPCGGDIGFDLSYAFAAYDIMAFPLAPDYQIFFSLCRPILRCQSDFPGQEMYSCGINAQLIPGCENAMLCALNKYSQHGITLLPLSALNLTVGNYPIPSVRMSQIFFEANATLCPSLASFRLAIYQSNSTTFKDLSIHNCQFSFQIASAAIVPYDQSQLEAPNGNSSSNTINVGLPILFGLLFGILCIVLGIGYRSMKRLISAASSDEYHLREAGPEDVDAGERKNVQSSAAC